MTDPAGDDHGPTGRYVYPTDASFGARRPTDLRRVQVAGSGGALRVDLTMAELSTVWNPANGFDHVAFTLFIELPGQGGGARSMPLQAGDLPEGLRWHRRLRVHGWSNALFSSDGAGAAHEGTPITPGASVEVDAAARRVRFTLPAAALGACVRSAACACTSTPGTTMAAIAPCRWCLRPGASAAATRPPMPR
ncbi:MAG: hypothetical protein IPP44_14980 [Ideonella sp.]|nr:hypothetical protein [Ideonella sp.]